MYPPAQATLNILHNIADCQDMIKQYEAQKLDTEAKLLELSKSELYINQIIKILKQPKEKG